MNTQPIKPAWKQEVNQRLAEHKNRKGALGASNQQVVAPPPGTSRAAEAAARVAARYAKAPSYTEMQAEEARAAVRVAEIATQVAIEAQTAAESALAELHAASVEQPTRGPAVIESITRSIVAEEATRAPQPMLEWVDEVSEYASGVPVEEARREDSVRVTPSEPLSVETQKMVDGQTFNIRWEADLPARALKMPAPARVQDDFELNVEDWWTPARVNATLHSEPIEVDASEPHANLVQFPRELVAARKVRPRLAASSVADDYEAQLSIFEVDPGTISTEPTTEQLTESSPEAWSGVGWSGMELDAHPVRAEVPYVEAPGVHGPYLAPLGLRLMAMAVDGALILASFFAAALWTMSKLTQLPSLKPMEAILAVGVILTGFAYHWFFFRVAGTTPGMWYAGTALCTFNDEVPTRAELEYRLRAMALSLLPVGIGMVWSVFDEDHLSWHDRISGTYLRKR